MKAGTEKEKTKGEAQHDSEMNDKEQEHVAAEEVAKDDTFLTDSGKQQQAPTEDKSKEERVTQPTVSDMSTKKDDGSLTTRLYAGHLTRNVNEDHLRAIFSVWGPLKKVEIAMDRIVQLPKGYAYLEFEKREDAEKALDHMHGGQIDGNILDMKFVNLPPKRDPSPVPVSARAPESTASQRNDSRPRDRDRDRDTYRRRSPIRYRGRSPIRRRSRSPRRRSPYVRRRSRSPPRRNANNNSYSYHPRGVGSPPRRRSPPRSRRRSPSPRYHRRDSPRDRGPRRTRRSSESSYTSSSKSSTMSSTSGSSTGSSSK